MQGYDFRDVEMTFYYFLFRASVVFLSADYARDFDALLGWGEERASDVWPQAKRHSGACPSDKFPVAGTRRARAWACVSQVVYAHTLTVPAGRSTCGSGTSDKLVRTRRIYHARGFRRWTTNGDSVIRLPLPTMSMTPPKWVDYDGSRLLSTVRHPRVRKIGWGPGTSAMNAPLLGRVG